jgi:AI-2 transport system permease protein
MPAPQAMLPAYGLGREATLAVACIAAVIVFSLTSPAFGTAGNMATVLRNSYELWLIALGMTLLMAMGAIDVSVGAAMGICDILVGFALRAELPLGTALVDFR